MIVFWLVGIIFLKVYWWVENFRLNVCTYVMVRRSMALLQPSTFCLGSVFLNQWVDYFSNTLVSCKDMRKKRERERMCVCVGGGEGVVPLHGQLLA